MTGKMIRREQPPVLRALRARAAKVWQHPEVKMVTAAAGVISVVLKLYQQVGAIASIGVAILALLVTIRIALRWRRRIDDLEEQLLAELPHQHAFLVEFLRQAYKLPGDQTIASRNLGLTIHNYQNDFVVRGTDCANHQRITGSNTGSQVARGLAFAFSWRIKCRQERTELALQLQWRCAQDANQRL